MRRLLVAFLVSPALVLAAVAPAFAHSAPPCNDTDGDGSPSGVEYAHHHIVPLAHDGDLGAVDHDGDTVAHTPGSHQGFSLCDPSG